MNGQTERDGPWQGLNKGAHVLYVYNEKEKYLANLLKFVIESIESEEAILLIEEKSVIENVIQSLESMGKQAGYPNFIHAEIMIFIWRMADLISEAQKNWITCCFLFLKRVCL
ncbi:hypothetical protein [Bacillus infantis]|uniref:hypothetical protein n=1 Tax=Bacillus infantis TaxID=324767 RepID=UPI003CE8A919